MIKLFFVVLLIGSITGCTTPTNKQIILGTPSPNSIYTDKNNLKDASIADVQINRGSEQYIKNFRSCIKASEYDCDLDNLTISDKDYVKKAFYLKNLKNCISGYSYSCDKNLLSDNDLKQIKIVSYFENLESCLGGYESLCKKSLLNQQDLELTKQAVYNKNLQNCRAGYSYSCKKNKLTTVDRKNLAADIASKQISSRYSSYCAENGSCYGDISTLTGNPKTTAVSGYYRKDGTYVRGHYRSR